MDTQAVIKLGTRRHAFTRQAGDTPLSRTSTVLQATYADHPITGHPQQDLAAIDRSPLRPNRFHEPGTQVG